MVDPKQQDEGKAEGVAKFEQVPKEKTRKDLDIDGVGGESSKSPPVVGTKTEREEKNKGSNKICAECRSELKMSTTDKVLLTLALFFTSVSIWTGVKPLEANEDPLARMNAILFFFLVVSLLIGLCTTIRARFWAVVIAVIGLGFWTLGVMLGDDGKKQAILDVFKSLW